ncbi:hypothetical protein DTO013E5_5454 [Penicillium roqueforti]|uniref:Genomic scaffold, ProqFM164S04 n=1 Tax=Penicillium roqueforti (strain FM164) TaxID=1365484 RepID=W6QIW1_PENRF|nr:hypothetical protein DTO012A1_5328 [Penicillium roqueforti]CDM35946.1 unnamed protein product [Penicillium roqueforti FM164]KAI2752779.1 hypothetical protein DTO013F2_3008 [Penicillium roqueforti]KAI2773828.1 hypothetical protein DTO012A8_1650 [Penicillium roqueforti]KAI3073995.1 hypothetical protein CBS147339_6067 [Penicillium roqueforti]
MQADVKAAAIENFQENRDGFVVELGKLSEGQTGGRCVPQIQTYLRKIFYTLSMWTLIREGSEKEGNCFEERCNNLMVLIEEISDSVRVILSTNADLMTTIEDPVLMKLFGMLSMQVGSLTLHGLSDEDTEAVESAKMVEREQRRWELKLFEEDDERRNYLRMIWARLYYKVHDCPCRQCCDFYLPTEEPTPSPPLPDLPEEEYYSSTTSSSSEED